MQTDVTWQALPTGAQSPLKVYTAGRNIEVRLSEMKQEWISYKEAQKITGLSRVTLWRIVKEGRIVVSRQGRAVRLQRQSIYDLMWHGVRSAEVGPPPSGDATLPEDRQTSSIQEDD